MLCKQVLTAKVSWFEAKRKIRKGERRTSKLALRGNLKRGKVRSCEAKTDCGDSHRYPCPPLSVSPSHSKRKGRFPNKRTGRSAKLLAMTGAMQSARERKKEKPQTGGFSLIS